MATNPSKTKSDATEALKQLTYLATALKAPRITESAARLADHARDAGWTHEEYLAAPLRADHRRRGRLPALRARRSEPVLPARQQPLRTRLADPHLEPALQRLG